eukprot:73488_1
MNTTVTESPFIEAYTANADEFYSQLYTSIPFGCSLLIIYCILRNLCINTFEIKRNQYLLASDNVDNKNMRHPSISSTGYFKWIYDTWKLDSNTIYSTAGFDATVFILFLRCCLSICVACMPYALLVLLPIYATSPSVDNSMTWLDILSLNSVPAESNRLYATLIGSYVFSFIALYYLFNTYLKIAHLTDQYLIDSEPFKQLDQLSMFNYTDDIKHNTSIINHKPHAVPSHRSINSVYGQDDIDLENEQEEEKHSGSYEIQVSTRPPMDRYTVMMQNVPSYLRDEHRLKQFMEQLFEGEILKVSIVRDVTGLIRIHKQIEYHEKKLESLAKTYDFDMKDVYNEDNTPEIYGTTRCCGENVHLITYHKVHRDGLVAQFDAIQNTHDLTVTSTAFVVFKSLFAASSFLSSAKSLELLAVDVSAAPPAQYIYWQNLYKSALSTRLATKLCIIVSMTLMLLFWSIPVVLIQGLANMEVIFALFDADIHDVFSASSIAWLQGTVTVLVLDIWLCSVPSIVDLFSAAEGASDRAHHELSILKKYYVCLVFMVLLVTVISSTALSGANDYEDLFKNIANHVGNIADLLADGLSNMSVYFLLYILVNTFMWMPLELFRPWYFISVRFNLSEPNRFLYSIYVPKALLIFTIVLTYSVMNPVMWIFGALYFLFAYCVFTYSLCMNWVPMFEIGPAQWRLIFDLIRYSFVISIVTLYGLMLLKQHYVCSVLLIPLLISIWIVTAKIKRKFDQMFNSAALLSARRKDAQIHQSNKELCNEKELNTLYVPPVLCIKHKQSSQYYQLP